MSQYAFMRSNGRHLSNRSLGNRLKKGFWKSILISKVVIDALGKYGKGKYPQTTRSCSSRLTLT